MTATRTPSSKKRSIFTRLYHGETAFDFIGRTKLWFAISGAVILAGLLSLGFRQLNLGIDFEGGAVWTVPVEDVTVTEAREVVEEVGLESAEVQIIDTDDGQRLRVQAEAEADDDESRAKLRDDVSIALAELADTDVEDVSLDEVGPSWGRSITEKAVRALLVFLVAITIYITLRFELKMALATLAALVHDILVTVGVYSITGFEVTPATVIAFLTILGYSIYDGIVVFDKVEENTRGLAASGRITYADTVNLSLNQTVMRSLNTSITALLPISSLLVIGAGVLGATTLKDFALALLIGLGASAYSSIFIASPLLAILKEREPRYASIRARLEGRGPTGPLTPAAAAAGAVSGAPRTPMGGTGTGAGTGTALAGDLDAEAGSAEADPGGTSPSVPGASAGRNLYGGAPRPRKKSRRR